jgi:tetratricopeptide (TPR) repeat protein
MYENVTIEYPRSKSAKWARIRIAKCYFELRDFENALSKYEEALAATSNKAQRDSILLQKGAVLESLGKYEEALENYNSIELRPATKHLSGIIMLATGRCYEQLGELEKARDSYESITQLDDNSPWRTEIEKRKEAVSKQIRTRNS